MFDGSTYIRGLSVSVSFYVREMVFEKNSQCDQDSLIILSTHVQQTFCRRFVPFTLPIKSAVAASKHPNVALS